MISRQKLIEELEESRSHMIPKSDGRHSVSIETVIDYISKFPPADQCVPLSEVYRVIAGHSDYHGDNILAALTCIAEGKEVKPVRPLPADQWIPCSILPPRGKKVLIHMAEDFYDTAWFDGYNFRTKEFFTTVENVIAWKYIEPYKGVE